MASTLVFLVVRRVLRLVGLGPTPDDKGGDRRPAPPVGSAAPPGCPPPLRTDRSPGPGHVGQAVASGALVGVPGDAGDAVALAPGVRATSMDLRS
jgi:hypothetical protein